VNRLGIVAAAAIVAMLLFFASMVRVTWHSEAPAPAEAHVAMIAHPHGQVAADPNAVSDHGPLTVPVAGIARSSIRDTWGEARHNGLRLHHGTDIMAPEDAQVIAAAPGTVEKLFFSNGGGGVTLYVRSADRLWSYYYAHLKGYAPGVHEGQRVAAGDLLGYVGDTGNAGMGNFHLHFGMSRMKPGEGWWQGEAVNPYRLLAGTGARG
jgi:peptidoglycan LD-endopeptidase LytH